MICNIRFIVSTTDYHRQKWPQIFNIHINIARRRWKGRLLLLFLIRCKRPSKLYYYWLVIFCTTNSSRVLARERWQTFENSWEKTLYLKNTLYLFTYRKNFIFLLYLCILPCVGKFNKSNNTNLLAQNSFCIISLFVCVCVFVLSECVAEQAEFRRITTF